MRIFDDKRIFGPVFQLAPDDEKECRAQFIVTYKISGDNINTDKLEIDIGDKIREEFPGEIRQTIGAELFTSFDSDKTNKRLSVTITSFDNQIVEKEFNAFLKLVKESIRDQEATVVERVTFKFSAI